MATPHVIFIQDYSSFPHLPDALVKILASTNRNWQEKSSFKEFNTGLRTSVKAKLLEKDPQIMLPVGADEKTMPLMP